MTREEAKEVFLNRGFIDGIYDGDKWREACVVISKWLEQEPTTKNDLGVDWDELKRKILMEVDGGIDDNWLRYADVCDRISNSIDEYIANLPSVIPQPKTGHWIDDTRLGYHVSVCSNCNWRGHGDTCLIYKPKYCPNCGARMVESQESENKE